MERSKWFISPLILCTCLMAGCSITHPSETSPEQSSVVKKPSERPGGAKMESVGISQTGRPDAQMNQKTYPVRVTVAIGQEDGATPKLSWVVLEETDLRGAIILVLADFRTGARATGESKVIMLPSTPPVDLGRLKPGDYGAYIVDVSNPNQTQARAISNMALFTVP